MSTRRLPVMHAGVYRLGARSPLCAARGGSATKGAEISRTPNKIIATLVAVLAAAALAPAASAASTDPDEGTQTELGQAVGDPADRGSAADARYSRTPTELGQRMATSVAPCLLYTSDAADDLLCVDLG